MTNIHHFTHQGEEIQLHTDILHWTERMCSHLPLAIEQITVIHCSDEELLEVNRNYLNHDYYTDIITFDLRENPGDPLDGDLFVSTERISENAEIHAVSYEQEFMRVMIHGILHLCGFGDKTESEAALMREKENYYLSL